MAILDHRVSFQPRQIINHKKQKTPYPITKQQHICDQTRWKNGEMSWVSLDVLKEQNPWLFVAYAIGWKITKHLEFAWVQDYIKNALIRANKAHLAQKQKSP